ncbi:hypothetical protein A1O1_07883 [Capronia coronata CBS 617.96]|uniref:F-box domain-containing protein n=1 Tax=Capronia coronata CBS 617.96 TaxID=1182541 RepID=W9XNL4_9EURO|nr:uncharacterized protein A1O1_07883 [Capronia coronata CBS 617.96]EXJ81818.1 hypothetical protein A1O1_07883 [Capronia coronata CBS 617.96]
MVNTNGQGRKTRQILLSFAPKPNAQAALPSTLPSEATFYKASSRSAKPPTQLPTEVWDQIFDSAGTLGLKTFRLVCRDWCAIGTARLFSTLYVNSWERSWARLMAVAQSQYAPLVKKILWNALALPTDCLDAENWNYRYQNLLRGLSHADTLRFYETFTRIYQDHSGFRGSLNSGCMEGVADALRSFSNLHHLVLSDDFDLETSCIDPVVRKRVQQDAELICDVSAWLLKPQMWVPSGRVPITDEWWWFPFKSLEQDIRPFRDCLSITGMTVDFWDSHWDLLWRRFTTGRRGFNGLSLLLEQPSVKSLKFRVKFCLQPWFGFVQPRLDKVLQHMFEHAHAFRQLQELDVVASFVEGGSQYMDFIRDQELDMNILPEGEEEPVNGDEGDADDEHAGHSFEIEAISELSRPTTTATDLVRMFSDEYGFGGLLVNTMFAEFRAELVRLPNLRTLHLHNVTLNARSMLTWLVNQQQFRRYPLSIYLHGRCIIYGLLPGLFLEILQHLDVTLVYDLRNLYCYTNFDQPWNTNFLDITSVRSSTRSWGVAFPLRMEIWKLLDVDRDVARLPARDRYEPSERLHWFHQFSCASREQWDIMLEPRRPADLSRSHSLDMLREHCPDGILRENYTYCLYLARQMARFEWVKGVVGDHIPVEKDAERRITLLVVIAK